MEPRLERLISDYQAAVADEVQRLHDGLPIAPPASKTEWACTDIPQKGVLADGTRYFKHGYGCAVHGPSGSVDFDFGERGEITGF